MRRPVMIIRAVLFFALICGSAGAQFDASLSSPSIAISNSGRTATATGTVLVFAVDYGAQKWWGGYSSNSGGILWTGGIGSNPATGTNGNSFAGWSGTLYPGITFGSDASNSSCVTLVTDAARLATWLPSGFSALDTAVGSAVTWDSGSKTAQVTLSSGDTVACVALSQGGGVRAAQGVTTGKVVFGFEINEPMMTSATLICGQAGFGNSSTNLASYMGANANSVGWEGCSTTIGGSWYYNGFQSNIGDWNVNQDNFYRVAVYNVPKSSGSYVFEYTIANYQVTLGAGLAVSGMNLQKALGEGGGGVGYVQDGTGAFIVVGGPSGCGSIVSSGAQMIAYNFSSLKVWNWNTTDGAWKCSGDPAVPSGGTTISSATYYPAASLGAINASITINTTGPFSRSIPTGFTCWETCATTAKTYIIQGANENYPPVVIESDRCRWVA